MQEQTHLDVVTCNFEGVSKNRLEGVMFELRSSVCCSSSPDFIVIVGASRRALHSLSKQPFVKYFFTSKDLESAESGTPIILSRWYIRKSEYFGNPLVCISDLTIAINDTTVRCGYEENYDVNIDSISVVATSVVPTKSESENKEHLSKLMQITESNPNVFFAVDGKVTCKSRGWELEGDKSETRVSRYIYRLTI